MAILEQEMLSFSFNLNKAPEAFERLLLILKESLKKYHVYVRLVKVLSHSRVAVKVTTEEDINIENFDEVILLSEFASYRAKTTTEEPVALYCQFEKGELSLKGVRSVGWTTTLDGDVVEVEDVDFSSFYNNPRLPRSFREAYEKELIDLRMWEKEDLSSFKISISHCLIEDGESQLKGYLAYLIAVTPLFFKLDFTEPSDISGYKVNVAMV